MKKATKYKIAIGILAGFVMPALIFLMAALSELTRWGGYTDVLPYVMMLVLLLMGNLITGSFTRRRVSR